MSKWQKCHLLSLWRTLNVRLLCHASKWRESAAKKPLESGWLTATIWRSEMGTPQILICAGEEVLRIALRVLQATHRTSKAMVAFFLRAPADLESVGRGGSTTITFVAKQLNHGLSLPTKQSGLALAIHLPNANLNNRQLEKILF